MYDHHSAELNLVEHEPEIRYLLISQNSPGAGWTVILFQIMGLWCRDSISGCLRPDPPAAENLLKTGIKMRSKFKCI
jgi:hypothetical protein